MIALPHHFVLRDQRGVGLPDLPKMRVLDDDGSLVIDVDEAFVRFTFEGGTQMYVRHGARDLSAYPVPEDSDPETLRHYALDQVIPRVLASEGHFVLHGGAVLAGGKCHLFIADTGRGKSTLCAALAGQGMPILSDDALIVERTHDGWCARAVYAGLRLLPDSMAALDLSGARSTAMAHYSDKRRVFADLPVTDQSWPIGNMFLLGDSDTEATGPRLSPVPPAAACMALIGQTFSTNPAAEAPARLPKVAALVAAHGVRRLDYPRDFAILPEIVRDLTAILTAESNA